MDTNEMCDKPPNFTDYLDCELLIDSVKKRPPLYHPGIRSKQNKAKLWEEIAAIVGRSEQECKTVWGRLRSSYARHLQKINKTGTNYKGWYLADQLAFLTDFMKFTTKKERRYRKPKNPITNTDENSFNLAAFKTEQLLNGKTEACGQEDSIEILDDSCDEYELDSNEIQDTAEETQGDFWPAHNFLSKESTEEPEQKFQLQHNLQNQSRNELTSYQAPYQHIGVPQFNSTVNNDSIGSPNFQVPYHHNNGNQQFNSTPNGHCNNDTSSFQIQKHVTKPIIQPETRLNPDPMCQGPKQITTSNCENSQIEEAKTDDPREQSTMKFFQSILFDIGRLSDRQLRMFKQDVFRDLNKYLDAEQMDE